MMTASTETHRTVAAQPPKPRHTGRWIAVGLLLGLLCGVLFGEYCGALQVALLALAHPKLTLIRRGEPEHPWLRQSLEILVG
jgi:hypothetical protein